MKEPRVLRVIESSMVSTTVTFKDKEYKFSKHIRQVIVPEDFDMTKLNRQVFVLGYMDDAEALKWYRSNAKTVEKPKEISYEKMVETLKANGYIAYKKKDNKEV